MAEVSARSKAVRVRFREAILEAGLDVFSEVGFESAQMREIADRAGVAVGTIYNLFKNKDHLYKAIIETHGAEIGAAFSELFHEDRDELEILYRFIQLKATLTEINHKALSLFFAHTSGSRLSSRAGLTPGMAETHDVLIAQLAEILKRAMEKGQLNSEFDPFDLAIALDGMTNAFVVLHLEHPTQHPYQEKVEMVFRSFFGSLATDGQLNSVITKFK